MKKYIFILGLTAMGLVSCEKDYLDTTPEGEVDTKTILSSTDNSTLSIAGIAKSMTSQYLHSQGFNGEGTIKTWYGNYPGNDFQKSNLTGWSPIINSQYHLQLSSSYDTYPWYYYYKLVSNANAIIENIDAAEGTEQQKAFIKAQALTDRAYSFFMLSQAVAFALAGVAALVAALGGVELPREVEPYAALVAVDIAFRAIANAVVCCPPVDAGVQDVAGHQFYPEAFALQQLLADAEVEAACSLGDSVFTLVIGHKTHLYIYSPILGQSKGVVETEV
jgi:hypothetical protein